VIVRKILNTERDGNVRIFDLKNKKIIVINFIIIIALALLSVLMFQEDNLIGSFFGVVVAFTILVFDNVIKNYKEEGHSRKKMLINIFTHCGIYVIIYGLILFVFKIEVILIIKTMVIQVCSLIYCISRYSVSKKSYIKQVVFYILFFSIFVGVIVYRLNVEMEIIDVILYPIVLAASVSALFCSFFVKLDDK